MLSRQARVLVFKSNLDSKYSQAVYTLSLYLLVVGQVLVHQDATPLSSDIDKWGKWNKDLAYELKTSDPDLHLKLQTSISLDSSSL